MAQSTYDFNTMMPLRISALRRTLALFADEITVGEKPDFVVQSLLLAATFTV
jgi:hypothetical protein